MNGTNSAVVALARVLKVEVTEDTLPVIGASKLTVRTPELPVLGCMVLLVRDTPIDISDVSFRFRHLENQ